MMRVLIEASQGGFGPAGGPGVPVHEQQYAAMRNEGRILVNAAFGLAAMGYEVEIVVPLGTPHEFAPNLRMTRQPAGTDYDYLLFWTGMPWLDILRWRKAVCVVNYPYEVERALRTISKTEGLAFACPYRHLIDHLSRGSGQPVEFFPPLHPAPSYAPGFAPYAAGRGSARLEVLLHLCVWTEDLNNLDLCRVALDRLKAHAGATGRKVGLTVQVDKAETVEKVSLPWTGDETHYRIGSTRYDEYLNMVAGMDLCIVKGGKMQAGGGLYDILALGKPLLYVSEWWDRGLFRNPLFEHPEHILVSSEPPEEGARKADGFFADPGGIGRACFNQFRDSIADSDFPRWRTHAERLLPVEV